MSYHTEAWWCDSCQAVEARWEAIEWRVQWFGLKAKGWRAWKDDADELWYHACPQCAEERPATHPTNGHGGWPWSELHLLPTAPRALVEAAYRVLTRECHPDVGGDHEAMVRLNAAIEALRESGGGS